jgi:hypothetical protein
MVVLMPKIMYYSFLFERVRRVLVCFDINDLIDDNERDVGGDFLEYF